MEATRSLMVKWTRPVLMVKSVPFGYGMKIHAAGAALAY
jgi:hypothetical protein